MNRLHEERILVLAPVGRDADLTAAALSQEALDSHACPKLEDLCSCIEEGAAVVVVAEEALTPDAVECIVGLLQNQPHWSDLPFIIMTSGGRSTALSLSHARLLERLGHVMLLERPARIVTLVTAARAAIRSRRRQYELRDRMEALNTSEKRFRSVFEHAAVGIAVFTPEGRFVQVNAAFSELTGYLPDELLSMTYLDVTHPADRPAAQARHQTLLGGADSYVTSEKRYVRKTGDEIWVRVSASAVRDEHGRVLSSISLVEEITYRKKAEEALTRQAAELARSNADLQQFAWVTSHDLREPIRTIIAFSQLLSLRYKDKLDTEADQALTFMETSAKRMEALVRDLLSYSRLINTEERNFTRVSLNSALDWAMSNLQTTIADAGTVITRGPLPDVKGDDIQIVQLFQNLLSNAVKYRGKEPPLIRIGAELKDGEVQVSVADNGPGIDRKYHERIFGLFKRLHGAEIQGTGLGLAICRAVVQRHGGRLWVESEPGHGATFVFTLPAAD
jgi:PAS domain S-box-containing protein